MAALVKLVMGAMLVLACAAARAQDPNLQHPHALVTVKRGDYSMAALVMHRAGQKSFRQGIALFSGHPGILRLREEGGEFRFEQRGNFLVRSRRHWLDEGVLVALVDAPSDQWASFSQAFRETPRYGADVAAVLEEVGRRFPVAEWTLVGTSEGSVSAFHAARMNPALARRVILTASVFSAGKNGPGLSGVDWSALRSDLLWVHHEDDPCRFTSYRQARRFAERTGRPLVTMRGGGPGRGEACEAFSSHGFVGVEVEAIAAMKAWIRTGTAPAQAGR